LVIKTKSPEFQLSQQNLRRQELLNGVYRGMGGQNFDGENGYIVRKYQQAGGPSGELKKTPQGEIDRVTPLKRTYEKKQVWKKKKNWEGRRQASSSHEKKKQGYERVCTPCAAHQKNKRETTKKRKGERQREPANL